LLSALFKTEHRGPPAPKRSPERASRMAMVVLLVVLALAAIFPPSAFAHKGISWAWNKSAAEEQLELDYRWADKELLFAARSELGQALLIGDPVQIQEAKRRVRRAAAGLNVDFARCQGAGRRFRGDNGPLYQHFRCRLDMGDGDLNSATMRGTLHVLGQHRFKFHIDLVVRDY